jgi:prepilin-type N-terminal cleavage/methylation domain-containing protein
MTSMRRGFTLIEMIVVLLVIAVTAGLTAPAMMRMVSAPADESDAAPLAALLRGARRHALESGSVVTVVVDPKDARYRADTSNPRGAGLLSEGELAFDQGVTLVSDSLRVRFTFRPDGSVFGDTLTVRGRWTSSRLSVDRWTGAIHVDAR